MKDDEAGIRALVDERTAAMRDKDSARAVATLADDIVASELAPPLGWSDTWQLVVNTATTIVTFLTVFLIQNSRGPGRRLLGRPGASAYQLR